jgi:integrase
MKLTPDAGPIKTRQTRIVPIHEHIIEQGFLDMVRKIGDGPLFYNLDKKPRIDVDPLKPSRSRAATTRAHLSTWVRELGVTDPEVSPTHAWRHTFKQFADRAGISEKVYDEITGHAPASEGRKYTGGEGNGARHLRTERVLPKVHASWRSASRLSGSDGHVVRTTRMTQNVPRAALV